MSQPKGHICCAGILTAMAGHDSRALMYDFPPKVWKRFRDDVFFWTHGRCSLNRQIVKTYIKNLRYAINELSNEKHQ